MADLEDIRKLIASDKGLAVVTTRRPNGSVQATVVNAGVLNHPVGGGDVVGFVALGNAHKLRYLRSNPSMTLTVRVGWEFATLEGTSQLLGPDDPLDGFDQERLPALLRDVFTAAGGTHDDWDTYDRVMREERRAAVLVKPERVYGSPS